jgi:DNA-directed RNA polymerase specialized sigma24 family protein
MDESAAGVKNEALIKALREEDFQGPVWDHLADELARYGYQVIRSWIGSTKIFSKCAAKGVACRPRKSERMTENDVDEIALEVVARALPKFRDKVLRVWLPDGKASLRTMFVTQCLFQFPNVYRRWLVEAKQLPVDLLEEWETFGPRREGDDPAGLIALRAEAVHALEHYVRDDRLRASFLLQAMGYTTEEIAEMLGTTSKALDSARQRHWKALQAMGVRPNREEGESEP